MLRTVVLFFVVLISCSYSVFASQCVELFPRYIHNTTELFKAPSYDFYFTQLKDSGLSEKALKLQVLHQLIHPENVFYDHVRVRVTSSYDLKSTFDGMVEVLHLAFDGSLQIKSYPVHVFDGVILNKTNAQMFLQKAFNEQKKLNFLDLKKILNQAYKNKSFLESVLQDVAKHHNWGSLNSLPAQDRSLKSYRLKNYYRLKEKIFSRTLDKMKAKLQRPTSASFYKIDKVDDVLAARIIVKSSSPLLDKHFVKKHFSKILKKHKAYIVRIEKKGVDDVKASGYNAIHVTIANEKNRHEIQIMTESMSVWHKWEHHIYKTKYQYSYEYRKALESYSTELAQMIKTLEKQISQKKLFFKTRSSGVTAESFEKLNNLYQKHYHIHSGHLFNKEFISEVLLSR